MSWFHEISDKVRGQVKQLWTYMARGVPYPRALHIIKETSSIDPAKRKGLPTDIALKAQREFADSLRAAGEITPFKRSEWIHKDRYAATQFNSPAGYRYLIDYTAQYRNPETGEILTRRFTKGRRVTSRAGSLLNLLEREARARSEVPSARTQEFYEVGGFEYIPGTVEIVGLFRTINT